MSSGKGQSCENVGYVKLKGEDIHSAGAGQLLRLMEISSGGNDLAGKAFRQFYGNRPADIAVTTDYEDLAVHNSFIHSRNKKSHPVARS